MNVKYEINLTWRGPRYFYFSNQRTTQKVFVVSKHALLFPPISEEEKFLSDLNLDETQPLSSGPLLDPVLAPLPWDSRSRDSKASRVTQSLRSQGGYTSLASSVFVQESRHTGKRFLALKAGEGKPYASIVNVMKSPRHETS